MTVRSLALAVASCVCLVSACGADPAGTGGVEPGGAAAQLSAQDFTFSPSSLAVEPGTEVTVEFTNEDGAQHSFTVEDLGVDLVVAGGEDGSVTFPAPETDTVFHCRFHPAMSGTITTGTPSSGGGDTEGGTNQEPGYDY